jgi:hypothetical protein
MVTHDVQIVHAIPGRIRVKIAKLKDHPALADELQQRLAGIPVVQAAMVNARTGSVLVTYDPHLLESLHTLECGNGHLLESVPELLALADLLGIRPEDVDTQPLEEWFRTHTNSTTSAASSTAAEAIAAFFGTLNTTVARASSGWGDLKALLPLVLFGLGVRGLLLAEQVPFPAWYDYFWFAFGTFMVLHPPTASQA